MNTNKPKPPRKLLSETVVELKTNYPTAMEQLRELSGVGSNGDILVLKMERTQEGKRN